MNSKPRLGFDELNTDDRLIRLIEPVRRRMYETVWRVLRHPQDAEDALQIALMTVWRQRVRIEKHPVPEALVLRICADVAIDQYRKRQTNKVLKTTLTTDLVSSQLPPDDQAVERETLDAVMDAISKLSPNQATAIVMRFLQGESDAEIASALGCGGETVREHLRRGKERLEKLLCRLAPSR